ncbi:MAG: hypothetical protein KBD76_16460 [Bacteriovorax sp.]|jgi:hypothetical protein|nr:hypothetical protein [Bacteriovorax sp.]
MFKHLAILCCFFSLILPSVDADAAYKKKKRKKGARSSRYYKTSKNKKRAKRYTHSSGPDLKAITTESPYKDEPSNGVNAVETKQPTL